MKLIQKCFLCILIYEWPLKIQANQDEEQKLQQQQRPTLKVYWNVPSFQCNPFLDRVNFSKVLEKYNFIQNQNGDFRGDQINILYDPGSFPALMRNSNKTILRNGGVPQEGNLTDHLNIFTKVVDQLVPDQNFSGIGIIDFESWRPIYRQNWGTLIPYQNLSEDIERQALPDWPEKWIKKEAQRRFEEGAKLFMETTLMHVKEQRPLSTWGYYGFPYCFNMSPLTMLKNCDKQVQLENDQLNWLFSLSDHFHPSVYLQESNTANQSVNRIVGRLDESFRIKEEINENKTVLPYYWYKYQDTENFVTGEHLFITLSVLASYDIEGIILWGASSDVNSKSNCIKLYNYIDNVFGPIVLNL